MAFSGTFRAFLGVKSVPSVSLVSWKSWVQITHPDFAALVDPLFACGGKRGTSFQ